MYNMKTALAIGFWNEGKAKFRDKLCEKFASSGSLSQILSTQHRTTKGVLKYLIILKIEWFSWYEQSHILGQQMDVYHKHSVGEGDYSFMPIQCVICETLGHSHDANT